MARSQGSYGISYYSQSEVEEEILNKKRSKKTEAKYKARQRFAKVEPAMEEQFATGRVLGIHLESFPEKRFIYFPFTL